MTKTYIFDTDCLSSFLWTNQQQLLILLFPNCIYVPMHVYKELSHPSVPRLKERLDLMIYSNQVTIVDIEFTSIEYQYYREMAINPSTEIKVIGKGEASVLAIAKGKQATVASNNLKDILYYVKKYKLEYITSAEILRFAYLSNLITMDEGNCIWQEMIEKRRKLPNETFSDYLMTF